jgi:hypothetical protein
MHSGSRPDVELATSCACGAVDIAVNGAVKTMLVCACEACQKATGTGHAVVAMLERASVDVRGETRAFARPADSGATFTRHFCPVCGVTVFAETSRAPDVVLLPVGLFGAETDWFAPSQMIFARSHRGWDDLAPDLARHATYRAPEIAPGPR